MVITGVADRAPDRIGHLVYLDAAMPVNGESLADIAAPLMEAARRDMRVVDGIELVLFPGTEPMPNYGVTEPRRHRVDGGAAHAASVEVLHATAASSRTKPALWEIPQSVICCTSNLAFRDPARMEPARAAGRVWDIDTGHDLMISEPDAVAELLLRVAAA